MATACSAVKAYLNDNISIGAFVATKHAINGGIV